jgi:SM-20-related protein
MMQVFDSIADGLAEQGYAIVDQFLSQNEVDAILQLEEFKAGMDYFKKAGIGQKQGLQVNESIRGDFIRWMDNKNAHEDVKIYFDKINALIQYLNHHLFLSLKDFEAHLTIYPAGSFYKRHLDQFKSDDHRKLSVICYLNKNWDGVTGGQLRLYLPEKTIDILPVAGKLVCFRSDQIEHEVLPATRERLSITGWILDQLTELRHL